MNEIEDNQSGWKIRNDPMEHDLFVSWLELMAARYSQHALTFRGDFSNFFIFRE